MRKGFLVAAPLLAALGTGASALVMSPAACSCISERSLLAASAGIPPWQTDSYDPRKLQTGLNRQLVGRPAGQAFGPNSGWCEPRGANAVECFAPQRRSWLLETGYLVRLTLGPTGLVEQAEVRRRWRLSVGAPA